VISVNADSESIRGIMYQNDKVGHFEFGDQNQHADYKSFAPDVCNGEYITEITIGYSCEVNSLQFKTNLGRESSKFGGKGNEEETIMAPAGHVLGALRVREDSDAINQIQFLWTINPANHPNLKLSNIFNTPYCVWDDPDTIRDDKMIIKSNNSFSSVGCNGCGKCPSSFSEPISFDENDVWSDLYGNNNAAGADYTGYPWFLRCAAWKVSVASASNNYIDAIGFQVDRIGSLWYGGFEDKSVETFTLDTCNGEFITEVALSYGCFVNSLQFKTNMDRVSSKFGGTGPNEDTVTAPVGYVLGGLRVRAEDHISQIQFLWVPNPSLSDKCIPFNVPYTPMCGYDGVAINYLALPDTLKLYHTPPN